MQKLARAFYERNTITVAKELLGKYLVHGAHGVERVLQTIEASGYGLTFGVHSRNR